MNFPIFKTKIDNSPRFDLTDAQQRQQYFQLKAGEEIERLRNWLKDNSFIAYMLGKKSSGKGTYAKMFKEVVADPVRNFQSTSAENQKDTSRISNGASRVEHFSIGDMIREFDDVVADKEKRKEFNSFLEKNYRGYLPLDEIIKSMEQRSTKVLLPSELILALVKKQIAEMPKKSLFIDGFPRGLDQISYSLFFRDLIGYRDDPDVFILIDVPEKLIDERIKYRVICPKCQTSRNTKLLPTENVGYDKAKKEFHLICENPVCEGAKMVRKEGDELGIEPIKERLSTDADLIKKAFSLHGIPKVLLRNAVPVDKADEYVNDYEITPAYSYKFVQDKVHPVESAKGGALPKAEQFNRVKTIQKPWQVLDDKGTVSYSLLAPPMVVSLIKQLIEALDI